MTVGLSQLASWNPTSQRVVAGCVFISLLVLISGVALTILKSFGTVPLILFCSGGGLLGASIIYGLILCVKNSSQPKASIPSPVVENSQIKKQNSQNAQESSSRSQTISLKQLTDDEIKTVIFNVLTESEEERKEAIVLLAQLDEKKSDEERARERLYTFTDKPLIIRYLIDTLPNFKELLVSLDSGMVYDSLTDYATKLTNESKIIQIFLLLDDHHRAALLRTHIKDKDLFLALIEKAPSSTKEKLRQSDWPELLQMANELLNAWFFKKVFYHVYAALSDDHQKSCLKRIIQESTFRSKRVEMIREMQAAVLHPIEFIEYALQELKPTIRGRTYYCGKCRPSLSNDTTRLFDAILPTLPKLHIVTFFWRIATENLKVWGKKNGWAPEFQGTKEEKEFFKSLAFDQVTRLSKTKQPWIAMWHPSEQPDEIVVDLCFKQLRRAQDVVIKYQDTEYNPDGILFKKNWDKFLHLLSFHQVSMLICRDPMLKELNQIFGFERKSENVPEKYLKGIPNSYKHISIPAVLQRWLEMSFKAVDAQERIEAIQALKIEEKYTLYLIYMHEEHERMRPILEAHNREWTERMRKADAFLEEWRNLKNTWSSFLDEKHQARIRAEQAQKRQREAQEEQKNLFAFNLEIIKASLTALGLKKTREYSIPEIEKIVRREFFKYHPDKHAGKSTDEIAKHEAQYKIIGNARDKLLEALTKMGLERTPLC